MLKQLTCQNLYFSTTLLEMLIFFMGLFEDSRSKSEWFRINRSNTFANESTVLYNVKRIFLYKTVGQFLFFSRCVSSPLVGVIGIASRQPSGKSRKVDDAIAVEVTILNWPTCSDVAPRCFAPRES